MRVNAGAIAGRAFATPFMSSSLASLTLMLHVTWIFFIKKKTLGYHKAY